MNMQNIVVCVTMNRAITVMDNFAHALDEKGLLNRVDRKRHMVYTKENDSYHFISKQIENIITNRFNGNRYTDETFKSIMNKLYNGGDE